MLCQNALDFLDVKPIWSNGILGIMQLLIMCHINQALQKNFMIKINNPELLTKLPNAILFDTDNTLYSYNEANEAAISAVRKKTKQMLSISTSEFDEAYDNARSSVKSMLGSTASSHSRLLYIQRNA